MRVISNFVLLKAFSVMCFSFNIWLHRWKILVPGMHKKWNQKKWVNARSDKYISNRAPCLLINKTAAASNKTKKNVRRTKKLYRNTFWYKTYFPNTENPYFMKRAEISKRIFYLDQFCAQYAATLSNYIHLEKHEPCRSEN